ncbi:GMC oxidoreductase [Ceratobasidium sp. AG-Ba]|nr:GMC oxidoreductase [Ceratobasidium sp. AG-Ba]
MDTYLKTARARPNFTLLTGTKALSVLRNGNQITGVQTDNASAGDNGVFTLTKKGRVILAAGVFGTARLLYQSGIGPSDMLSIAAADPPTSKYMPPPSQYIDLPVGMHVTDNPAVRAVFTHPTIDGYNNWANIFSNPRPADAAQYVSNRSGPLTAPSARVNFWRAYKGSDGRKRYIQATCRPGGAVPQGSSYNASATFTCTMYASTGITSVGRIGINSTMWGVILQNPWLVDPVDRATLETAFSDFLSTYKQVPNLQLVTPNSTTSIPTHIQTATTGSNHWVGSTRIGSGPTNSVVDRNTKVWKTKNLFIVDAGIFPGMPTGNPVGSFLVMAEMASHKILGLRGGP